MNAQLDKQPLRDNFCAPNRTQTNTGTYKKDLSEPINIGVCNFPSTNAGSILLRSQHLRLILLPNHSAPWSNRLNVTFRHRCCVVAHARTTNVNGGQSATPACVVRKKCPVEM
jgi:hypothetical protein